MTLQTRPVRARPCCVVNEEEGGSSVCCATGQKDVGLETQQPFPTRRKILRMKSIDSQRWSHDQEKWADLTTSFNSPDSVMP